MPEFDLQEIRDGFAALAGLATAPTAHQVAEAAAEAETAASAAPEPPASAPTADWGFNPFVVPGDPDVPTYSAMSPSQMALLEVALPGVTERLSKAQEWEAASIRQAGVVTAETARADHNAKLKTDPEYLALHVRGAAARRLADDYRWLTDTEKAELRAEAEMGDEDYAKITVIEERRIAVESGADKAWTGSAA